MSAKAGAVEKAVRAIVKHLKSGDDRIFESAFRSAVIRANKAAEKPKKGEK